MAKKLSDEFKRQAKSRLDPEKAREMGRRSAEVRRQKRSAREFARAALDCVKEVDGKKMYVKDIMIQRILEKALNGDLKAARLLLELVGEAPTQRMEVTGKDGAPLMPDSKILTADELRALHKKLDAE